MDAHLTLAGILDAIQRLVSSFDHCFHGIARPRESHPDTDTDLIRTVDFHRRQVRKDPLRESPRCIGVYRGYVADPDGHGWEVVWTLA